MGSDEFTLARQFLASMLGARRASVGGVAKDLPGGGPDLSLPRHRKVLDRIGLEADGCGCYRVIEKEFDRPPGASS